MPFAKGQSGNVNGRPKGALNKASGGLRETISAFLQSHFAKVASDFQLLPPKDRARLYIDLLNFALPKLQSSPQYSFEAMSDEQLDALIEKLKKAANENE